ncbi:hypothetical protein A3715_32090 [Oleiphilus sp. HI0009]|nr:hypothetical protein A3715_14080 [Oleiphilus sp. HI0009]KZX83370.1 hypothetical protein A3715_32090 [Oleiphilus sp. HI0009]
MLNFTNSQEVTAEIVKVSFFIGALENEQPSINDEKYRKIYREDNTGDTSFVQYEDDCNAFNKKMDALKTYRKELETIKLSFEARTIMEEFGKQQTLLE